MIDNIDFRELESERYFEFSATFKGDKKQKIKSLLLGGDYMGTEKKDGFYERFVYDDEGLTMQSRDRGVNGEFNNKIDWVPHIATEMKKIPAGTVFLTEVYIEGGESKTVTKVLGCGLAKALERQKDPSLHLKCYIFDVWAWAGKSLLGYTYEERMKILTDIITPYFSHSKEISCAVPYQGLDLIKFIAWLRETDKEGAVITLKSSKPEPGARTSWKTLKIKKELDNPIDAFLSGNYNLATKEYSGNSIPTWPYWQDVRTNALINDAATYLRYQAGEAVIPVTKAYFYGWATSVEVCLHKADGEIYSLGWISGITDEVKEKIVTEPQKYLFAVVKINAMSIDEESHKLRHGKIIEWRTDISHESCTYDKVFGN